MASLQPGRYRQLNLPFATFFLFVIWALTHVKGAFGELNLGH